MDNGKSESRAYQQRIIAALLGFVIGAVGFLTLCTWLTIRYALSEVRWWQLIHLGFHAIYWAFIVGVVVGLLTGECVDRWHHARGVYRCGHCGAQLRMRTPCSCRPEEERQLYGRPTLMRAILEELRPAVRKACENLPLALAGYALLIPVVYALMQICHTPRRLPFGLDLAIGHMICSVAVALLCECIVMMLEFLKTREDLRQRLREFMLTFLIWPAIAFPAMALAKLF